MSNERRTTRPIARQRQLVRGGTAAKPGFSFSDARAAEVVEPNTYELKITESRLTCNARGNWSVILAAELEDGTRAKLAPLFVDGPNAAAGGLAEQNRAIVADMAKAAGIKETDDPNVMVEGLAGNTITVDLAIARDGIGTATNQIDAVWLEGES